MKKVCFILLIILISVSYPAFSQETKSLEMYDLMYRSFMYSNDNENAYNIAKKMVNLEPKNIKWRKRLAQLCMWLGKQREAFTNYLYIYNKTKDKDIQDILFTFPYKEITNLKIKIYEDEISSGDYKHLDKLIELYNLSGYPEKSIKLLEMAYVNTKDKKYLITLLKYHINFGNMPDINYFKFAMPYLTENEKIKLATLYINKRKYNEAYKVLTIANTLPANDLYYKLLLSTAIKLKKYEKAEKLLNYLNAKGKLTISEFYYLLNYYLRNNDYDRVKFLLEKGIFEYKSQELLSLYITLLLKDNDLQSAIKTLNNSKNIFKNQKDFLILYAQLLAKLNEYDKSKKIINELIQQHYAKLTNNDIKGIIWLMIDNKNYFTVDLVKYLPLFRKKSGLELELISGYLAIQQIDNAEVIAKKILKNYINDLEFLLLYSDILNIQTRFEESNYYKQLALNIVKKRNGNINMEDLYFKNYLRLVFEYKNPEDFNELLNKYKNSLSEKEYAQFMVDYYFFSRQYDKLFYIYNFKKVY
ncbi:MAG: polysaccharide biosynthesis protein PelB [Deferribacteres bacterium]|jgi:tetratricopeptide (TPR) repeat protein|nr:tetratricopeptide repeat domain protein [Deferribacteraceae bacterium]MDK2793132.1 polysaccharide biosynthesis protein PelB [Deferribacteres bacterium]